jgi:choline dehydrogenase-like flavoprotein
MPQSYSVKYPPSAVVDFVIVGSGAAGGVLAKELSVAGFAVVVLEKGPRLRPEQFAHDEYRYLFQNEIGFKTPVTWREHAKQVATPASFNDGMRGIWAAQVVGGSSVHFTANFWRFRPVDFDERSRLGAIPGASLADWPISYDDLEPYYTKVDWEVGVSGAAGGWGEPRRSRPYPGPAAPGEVGGRPLRACGEEAGVASIPCADGDSLAAAQRARRVPELRLLHGLRLRVRREELHAGVDDPDRRAHGAVRGAGQLSRAQGGAGREGARHGGDLLRRAGEGAAATCPRRRPRLQRRRDAAPAAHVEEQALSPGTRQLVRHGWQAPDVQRRGHCPRVVRAPAQRVQGGAGHAHRPRLVRLRREARLLRWWRAGCARRPDAADLLGTGRRCARATQLGERLQGIPRAQLHAADVGDGTHHLAPRGVQHHHARSHAHRRDTDSRRFGSPTATTRTTSR